MNLGQVTYILFSLLLIAGTFFPFTPGKHWIFRISDFLRLQLLALKILLLAIGLIVLHNPNGFLIACHIALCVSIATELFIIAPYLPTKSTAKEPGQVKLISVNVLQDNQDYDQLIDLVKEEQPDILLTVESNKDWEKAMKALDNEFSYVKKIARENTYGMHFYTRLKVIDCEVYFFLTDDRPSLRAELETADHERFVFWGLHPPPPSPSEETTSKKKDGELMVAAKHIHECDKPVIVTGDFNNVCWSGIARLFARVSGLNDARIGRGLYSTFPVKPAFMRYPLDLLYHSDEIEIKQMGTLRPIGSDHLPFRASFNVQAFHSAPADEMEDDLEEEVNEIVQDGVEAQKQEAGS